MQSKQFTEMYVARKDYEGMVNEESGKLLTDIFPNGMWVEFLGDEILSIGPNNSVYFMDDKSAITKVLDIT